MLTTSTTRAFGLARLAVLMLVAASAGCKLPAIDPTGRRIFSGGTTTLACDHIRDCPLFGSSNTPPAPVPPNPPCAPPLEVGPVIPMAPPIVAVPAAPAVPIIPVGCGSGQLIQQQPLAPKLQVAGPICAEAQADCGPLLKVTPSRIVAPVGTEVVLAAGICNGSGYYVTRQPLEWTIWEKKLRSMFRTYCGARRRR